MNYRFQDRTLLQAVYVRAPIGSKVKIFVDCTMKIILFSH